MTANLLEIFQNAVRAHGPKTAIVEGDGSKASFDELAARISGTSLAWRKRGIGPGDQILIAMPVSANLYVTLAALWSLGATAVLPEPAMGLAGVRHALKTLKIKGLAATGIYRLLKIISPKFWFAPLLQPSAGDGNLSDLGAVGDAPALISFTSGTTGKPKAIARDHQFLTAQYQAVEPLLYSGKPEIDLVAFPVFVLVNLAAGRTSILPSWHMSAVEQVSPEVLTKCISKNGVTRALLPPALTAKLVNANSLPISFSHVFTGGGPVFPDLVNKLLTVHPNLSLTSVYGSTEAEPIAHINAADVGPADLDIMKQGQGLLAGTPVPEVKLKIVESEILVSGKHVNETYLNPEHDLENKVKDGKTVWHRTGDAGHIDDQGRLWLLGRWGAKVGNLFPFQIELAARFWPGVDQAALIEISDKRVLAIQGKHKQQQTWIKKAQTNFPDVQIVQIPKMPLDRRHRSKIDLPALKKILQRI